MNEKQLLSHHDNINFGTGNSGLTHLNKANQIKLSKQLFGGGYFDKTGN